MWPIEEREDFGIVQSLFNLMCAYLCEETESSSKYVKDIQNSKRSVEHYSGNREVETTHTCNLHTFLVFSFFADLIF